MSKLPRLDVPQLEAVFADGRSSACWQRQVAHTVARQAALARVCTWVDEIVKPPLPALKTSPLLGGCLAELVESSPSAGEKAGVQRTRQAYAPVRSPDAGRLVAKKHPFMSPHQAPSRKAPSLTKEVVAHPDLLRRRAGKTAVFPPSPSAAPRRAVLTAGSSRRTMPPDSAQQPQNWANQMLKRTREQLALAEKTITPRQFKGGTRRKLAKSMIVNETLSANLEAQWQQPLFGQTAPLELLARWQAGSMKAVEAADMSKPVKPTGADSNHHSGQTDTAVSTNFTSMETIGAAFASPASGSQERPSLSTAHTHAPIAPGGTPYPDAVADAPYELLPRFAPPQVARMLPQLRPLPEPGTTAVFPIASAVAEQSARRERESAPEDLDTLARQLKQILDEESRRHGIDV